MVCDKAPLQQKEATSDRSGHLLFFSLVSARELFLTEKLKTPDDAEMLIMIMDFIFTNDRISKANNIVH